MSNDKMAATFHGAMDDEGWLLVCPSCGRAKFYPGQRAPKQCLHCGWLARTPSQSAQDVLPVVSMSEPLPRAGKPVRVQNAQPGTLKHLVRATGSLLWAVLRALVGVGRWGRPKPADGRTRP